MASRVELTYAAKNPKIVYALVDTEGGQIWKSTDGGRTYERIHTVRGKDNEGAGKSVSILGDQGRL